MPEALTTPRSSYNNQKYLPDIAKIPLWVKSTTPPPIENYSILIKKYIIYNIVCGYVCFSLNYNFSYSKILLTKSCFHYSITGKYMSSSNDV